MTHLGPVAIIGLFLDWAILYFRGQPAPAPAPAEPIFTRPESHLVSLGLITLAVLAGFLAGLAPALVAAVVNGDFAFASTISVQVRI